MDFPPSLKQSLKWAPGSFCVWLWTLTPSLLPVPSPFTPATLTLFLVLALPCFHSSQGLHPRHSLGQKPLPSLVSRAWTYSSFGSLLKHCFLGETFCYLSGQLRFACYRFLRTHVDLSQMRSYICVGLLSHYYVFPPVNSKIHGWQKQWHFCLPLGPRMSHHAWNIAEPQ